jgi:hypothetical protein
MSPQKIDTLREEVKYRREAAQISESKSETAPVSMSSGVKYFGTIWKLHLFGIKIFQVTKIARA